MNNMKLTETFGYRLADQRLKRGWSEGILAEKVNASLGVLGEDAGVSAEMIHQYESNKAVPSAAELHAFAEILIYDNPNLSQVGKEAAHRELLEAAERTREALSVGGDNAAIQAFSQTLKRHRLNAGFEHESDLADAINRKAAKQPVDAMDIWKYEHGHDIPLRDIFLEMVRALDRDRPLSDEEKKGIYESYQTLSALSTHAQMSDVARYKEQLRDCFTDENGERLSGYRIAQLTGIKEGALSRVLSPDFALHPRPDTSVALENGLKKLGKSEEDIDQFRTVIRLLGAAIEDVKLDAARTSRGMS